MATRQFFEGTEYVPHAWETPDCPFCGSADHVLYERFGHKLQFTYVRCLSCQLVYTRPRPAYDAQFIHDAYEFYADDGVFDSINPDLTDSVAEATELLSFDGAKTRVLDVGTAMGNFCAGAQRVYPAVEATEVSQRMAQSVRERLGISVHVEQFHRLPGEARFSAIRMSHVIEHVPNPLEWLAHARALLVPGGVLCINVPHMFSLGRRVKRRLSQLGLRRAKWAPWRTPDHLFEPTIPAMHRALARAGYEVLAFYTYSRSNMLSRGPWAALFHRRLRWGNNLRYYVRPKA